MNKKSIYLVLLVAVTVLAGLVLSSRNEKPPVTLSEYESTDIAGLPEISPTQAVELKNGGSYDLTASYVKKNIGGTEYRMLAYNGSIPGPTIKVPQGAGITVNFKNDTGMKTLLHSHGVRMDNKFDGSQTTQKEMEPGETFSYELKFPDAGVYWYHPHVRDDFAQELGLYGNFIVTPSEDDYFPPVNREAALFLDDILIENGKINLSAKTSDRALMGRFGNVMLVNGEENYVLKAEKGEIVRLYVTNAGNTRTFNFAIPGVKMKLVGGDGGAYEKERFVDSVILGPSERAVIDILIDKPAKMVNQTPFGVTQLASISINDEPVKTSYATEFNKLRENGIAKASIDPFREYFDKKPDKQISLTVDMSGMSSMGGHMMQGGAMMGGMMAEAPGDGIEWEENDMAMMNAMSGPDSVKWNIVDRGTGKKNMDIDWIFKRLPAQAGGRPVKIRIFNDPNSAHPMQHPIHFHGQRFLVVSRDGATQTNLVWKDTVLVKSGETVDIVLDTSNPGVWMAHCHILEHIESGMMMKFKVE